MAPAADVARCPAVETEGAPPGGVTAGAAAGTAACDCEEMQAAASWRLGAVMTGRDTAALCLPTSAAQAKLIGPDGRFSPQADEDDVSRAPTQDGRDGGSGSGSHAAAHFRLKVGTAVAPCEQTCAADQDGRGAKGAAPDDPGLPPPPGASITRRLGDGICSLMARGSGWMYACFVAAAFLGAAPRFFVLLACQAVPQLRMPEAADFKTIWAPCKDPRNAFTAASPNGTLHHMMVLSDQGLSIMGTCLASIAALRLMYPQMDNTRGGRLVSHGCRCCACLDALHTRTHACASTHLRAQRLFTYDTHFRS